MKSVALLLGIGASVVALTGLGAASRLSSRTQESPARAQQKAWQASGLEAAATITGTYRRREDFTAFVDALDFAELIQFSHAVVLGTTGANRTQLSADGKSAVTLVTLSAQEWIKEPASGPQKSIEVSLPGGMVGFASGATAEVVVPQLVLPVDGSRVVMFLRREPESSSSSYHLASGPVSLYILGGRPFVAPSGGAPTTPISELLRKQRLDGNAFLAMLRTEREKLPPPARGTAPATGRRWLTTEEPVKLPAGPAETVRASGAVLHGRVTAVPPPTVDLSSGTPRAVRHIRVDVIEVVKSPPAGIGKSVDWLVVGGNVDLGGYQVSSSSTIVVREGDEVVLFVNPRPDGTVITPYGRSGVLRAMNSSEGSVVATDRRNWQAWGSRSTVPLADVLAELRKAVHR